MQKLTGYLALLFLVFAPAAARAEWREAQSNNFLVYSEGSAEQLREFTGQLEKLHFVLRAMNNVTRPPSPTKLRVFLMKNADAVVGTMAGGGGGGVQGYFDAHSRGPFIVGTRSAGGSYTGIDPESVLRHEYAHHFMFSYFPATYPTWYTEGFAEFWGSIEIGPKDVVEIGKPAAHRFRSFEGNRWLPLSKILGARSYADLRGDVDLIYAEGWLLLRYLFEHKPRAGQLAKYLNAINAGTSYEDAMDQAFGKGARELNAELRRYAGSPRFNILHVPFKPIATGPIAVRTLGPAEQALFDEEIQISRGLFQSELPAFLEDVRAVAKRFPGDPHALAMLAEAERLAGNHAAAVAAADRLLAVKPDHARGLAQKALARLEMLKAGGSTHDKAWHQARQGLVEAIKRAPNDPLILEAWYDSFVLQGQLPPAGPQNALFTAHQLVPANDNLRYKVAADFERRGMIEEAIAIIRPAALAMRHDEDEKEKKRRERLEEKWRLAGHSRRETALEMLTRLQEKAGRKPGAEEKEES